MRTRVVLISLAIVALPLMAEAAGAPKTFKELTGQIFTLLTSAIATLVALGIVIYLWGIASNMWKLSEGDPKAYRSYVVWGIIVIFVMVSIIGIVQLLSATFFQGGAQQPAPQNAPTSLLNNLNGK